MSTNHGRVELKAGKNSLSLRTLHHCKHREVKAFLVVGIPQSSSCVRVSGCWVCSYHDVWSRHSYRNTTSLDPKQGDQKLCEWYPTIAVQPFQFQR